MQAVIINIVEGELVRGLIDANHVGNPYHKVKLKMVRQLASSRDKNCSRVTEKIMSLDITFLPKRKEQTLDMLRQNMETKWYVSLL